MRMWNPVVVKLAKRSRDESLSPVEKLTALAMLGAMAQMGVLLTIDTPKENKPEFVWRNGAKVRVK
jgi:hypothetical protein